MALVGLDLKTQYSQYNSLATPKSTYILTPDKLETAVAHTVAQLVWIGKGSLQAFPCSYSFLCTQRGESVHPVEDSTLAVGQATALRR